VPEIRLWSVTEIIKQGMPAPALMNWGVRVTAEYAVRQRAAWAALADSDEEAAISMLRDVRWRTSGKAADRGTGLHAQANALALGVPLPPPEPAWAPHMAHFKRFLSEWQPTFVAAEARVFNQAYNYAGTLDAIVQIGGKQVVLDIKTTDKGPGESRHPFNEVALQLCAYSRAERIGMTLRRDDEKTQRYYYWNTDDPSEPLPPLDGALCLVVSPVDYALHPIRVDDTVWHMFLHVREVARWVNEVGRTVVGGAVTPPAQSTAGPAGAATPSTVVEPSDGTAGDGASSNEQAVLAEAADLVAEGVLVPADDGSFEAMMHGQAFPLQGGPGVTAGGAQ
jgi:hypothetical protein